MKLFCKTLAVFFLFSISVAAQIKVHVTAEKAINAVMQAQIESWNKGNLDRFMEGYWNDPDLVFVGKNGPTYGYENTLENYKKNYPDKKSMGQLHFDILHLQQWDRNTIQLIGKFTLKRENDQPTGFFTLLFRRIKREWKIVSDHSSS